MIFLQLIELVLTRHLAGHLHFDDDHPPGDATLDVGKPAFLVLVAVQLNPLATKKPTHLFKDAPD